MLFSVLPMYAQNIENVTGLELPDHSSTQNVPFDIFEISIPKWNYKNKNKNFDLIEHLPPVLNQGVQGSCVAFSLGYGLVSYYEKSLFSYSYNVKNHLPDFTKVYSPSFIFNGVKNKNVDLNCINGIRFTDAFDFIQRNGVAKWSEYPYFPSSYSCSNPIGQNVFNGAKDLIGYRFFRVDNREEILKAYLLDFKPIIVGIWASGQMAKDGFAHGESKSKDPFIWKPKADDIDGYHAMLVVGFDDNTKQFILMNSWGYNWGNNGYCYIPYHVFYERAREFYILRLGTRPPLLWNLKGNKMIEKLEGTVQAFDYRNTNSQTDSLFRADLDMLNKKSVKTTADEKMIQKLLDYFK